MAYGYKTIKSRKVDSYDNYLDLCKRINTKDEVNGKRLIQKAKELKLLAE